MARWADTVLPSARRAFTVAVTAALEVSAVIVEWLYYRACSEQLKKPLLFALLANAFSYGMGCVINLL